MKQSKGIKKYIGLTGGIGAGKTTAAEHFQKLGAFVIDADVISRGALNPGTTCYDRVVETFGKQLVLEERTIDRKALASIVFSDEQKRQELNSIIHPYVLDEMRRMAVESDHQIVLLDVPLLFESDFYQETDKNIVVIAEDEIRISRVMERSNMTREEALERINSQIPQEKQASMADYVITNNSTLEDLYSQVESIYSELVYGGCR